MDKFVTFIAKLLIVFLGSFALSACGDILNPDEKLGDPAGGAATDRLASNDRLTTIAVEENALRMNPECGEADEEFLPAILEIIERFNTMAESDDSFSPKLTLAGHPNLDGGISVRVCADSQISAHAYLETVAIHDGLLHMLKESAVSETIFESAVAFVIYHELWHTQMGDAALSTNDTLMELTADFFAMNTIEKVGYDTTGAELVFSVLIKVNPGGSPHHMTATERAEAIEVAVK
ncbi:hypothetical protein MNBD_NITROSPINAE01-726 [hydrothermal vent metagenome]|uniref:Uncharacterized protein n=1 Tax=hydrothermal vent metagenome TaxID=652676 RepID=A0A3B1C072_9ZZZZ